MFILFILWRNYTNAKSYPSIYKFRKDEKNQLINLNNRLAVYVEKVRSFESQNSYLQRQLSSFEENRDTEVRYYIDIQIVWVCIVWICCWSAGRCILTFIGSAFNFFLCSLFNYSSCRVITYTGVILGRQKGSAPLGLALKGAKYVWPTQFFGK